MTKNKVETLVINETPKNKTPKTKEWLARLTEAELEEWSAIVNDWQTAENFIIERYIGEIDESCELHVFCDASLAAYGAVIYLVKDSSVHILFSKSRVHPLKKGTLDPRLTIPKLELLGTLVGVRALKFVIEEMKLSSMEKTKNFFCGQILKLYSAG